MMNNSTKINKTNNYLSYQTNEHKKYHKLEQKAMKYQVLAWDRHNNVAWLNQLIWSKSFPSDNWISNENTDINNQYKTCFPLKLSVDSKPDLFCFIDLILIFGVLMPLSTIFQLYHGDQF